MFVLKTNADYVYVYSMCYKRCADHGIKVSTSAPYLQEMDGLAERYFGVVMEMARAMLKTSGMHDQYWNLAVHHATHLKNRLPPVPLDDRSPYEMVFQYKPDSSHVPIFGSRVQPWLPPQERGQTC